MHFKDSFASINQSVETGVAIIPSPNGAAYDSLGQRPRKIVQKTPLAL